MYLETHLNFSLIFVLHRLCAVQRRLFPPCPVVCPVRANISVGISRRELGSGGSEARRRRQRDRDAVGIEEEGEGVPPQQPTRGPGRAS